jgi:hypothetical protein
MTKWRTETKPAAKPVPPNYLALLLSDNTSEVHWKTVPDDWRCPVCQRPKHAVVYIDKKKDVTMLVHSVNARASTWRSVKQICNHCFATMKSLKWELDTHTQEPFSIYDIVTPEDVRKLIIPRAHSHHRIDMKRAELFVDEIVQGL